MKIVEICKNIWYSIYIICEKEWWWKLLKKGQIKFTKKAAKKARKIIVKEKADNFIILLNSHASKPPSLTNLSKKLLEVKQDISAKTKLYTNNIKKSEKFFYKTLVNIGKLSLIFSPSFGCVLYIDNQEQSKYENLKLPKLIWPTVYLNESDPTACKTFETVIKTKSIDLADLILETKGEI